MVRTAMGVVLAPVVGLLAGVVAVNLAHPEGFGWLSGPIPRSSVALIYLMMMSPMAFGGMIILGWPTSHWLTRHRITSVVPYVLLGTLFGLLTPALVFSAMSLLKHHVPTVRFALFPFGVLQPMSVGITTALVFWLITVRQQRGTTTPPTVLPSRVDAV
jgi:hypothetical protein